MRYAAPQSVDWFDRRRLLDPIGTIPPAAAEANFYTVLETSGMAAWLTSIGLRQARGGSDDFGPHAFGSDRGRPEEGRRRFPD